MKLYDSIILNKNPVESFKDFIRKSFSENFDISISNKKLDSIKESIRNNVLIIEDYEFNISRENDYENKNKYEISYYKINKDKDVRFLFGCELETCILTQCSDNNLLVNLLKYKEIEDEEMVIENWILLVKTYIENVMFKYVDENFISKFRYGCIIVYPKDNIIDYIIDFKKKIIYKNKNESFVNKYKYVIFTRDSSLVCGDNIKASILSKDKITKSKLRNDSFHCEIVSPIFRDINDIIVLYQFLFRNDCFRGNESSAFHVNVSMLNSKNEPIYFSKGFLDCFLDVYEKYEKKNYDSYRPYGSWYAKRIREHSLGYTYKETRPLLRFNNKEETEYFYKNFIKGKKYYRSFIELQDNYNAKYNSIHTKERYIMEFRLFPTQDDKKILMDYISDSIELLSQTNEIYSVKYNSIINNLQKLNTEVDTSYEPLIYYQGFVYYNNGKDYMDLKDFEKVFVEFEETLSKHNQRIVKYWKVLDDKDYDEFECYIYDEKNNENKKFILKFYNNDGSIEFEIKD